MHQRAARKPPDAARGCEGGSEEEVPTSDDRTTREWGAKSVLCVLCGSMVPWRMEARLAATVRAALLGWLFFCLTVASDVARQLRSSDLSV